MKNNIFKKSILTILLALPFVGMSQSVHVTLSSQVAIDAFMRTNITGSLTIQEAPGNKITSLARLRGLTSVGGDLLIQSNSALTSLIDLENLTSVGGSLIIESNAALRSLNGLENINRVGKHLYIGSNETLTSLSGLDKINRVGGNLSISSNDALRSLSGLEALTTMEGYLWINLNAVLTSLSGLEALNRVGEFLSISSNDALINLCAIKTVVGDGDGKIAANEYTVSKNAHNPTYIEIQETDECSVTNTATLYAGSITLTSQVEVDAFTTTYAGITNITGSLRVIETENNSITDLSNLRTLTSVNGDLVVNSNTALISLRGLDNINRVGGSLTIWNNEALTSLSGLENITRLGGSLNIGTDLFNRHSGNPNLTNLCGIRQLITNEQVNGNKYFVGNNGYNPTTYTEIPEICSIDVAIYIGNIRFSSQESIDAFSTVYTNITGHLIVRETEGNNITDLSNSRYAKIL